MQFGTNRFEAMPTQGPGDRGGLPTSDGDVEAVQLHRETIDADPCGDQAHPASTAIRRPDLYLQLEAAPMLDSIGTQPPHRDVGLVGME